MAEYSQKRRNGNPSGGREPMAMSAAGDSLTKLPDELATEILSRLGTLNEVVRCSSLLCKRWRNIWRLIDGGVLDFDELPQKKKILFYTTPEEKGRLANRVNQALTCFVHHRTNLDALRVGFYYLKEPKEVERWIKFGLIKRAKDLTFLSYFSSPKISVSFLTSEFLSQHDLSRLEVLQLKGVSGISQAAVDHIFSNSCPSLRCFALRNFSHEPRLVVRVCSSNKLQSLDFGVDNFSDISIELTSAPSLQTFKFIGNCCTQLEFVGDLPQLREVRFGGSGLHKRGYYLPWSRSKFRRYAPRLQQLSLDLGWFHFEPPFCPRLFEWMVFEKLRKLDLFIYLKTNPASYLECTVLLRAAPLLEELSIWLPDVVKSGEWERRDLSAESTWKHNSLKVLRLHGLHPARLIDFDVRKPQLELAAYIIMNAPSLDEVLIDNHHPASIGSNVAGRRPPRQVDADIYEVQMELESQLQDCPISPLINFTYR